MNKEAQKGMMFVGLAVLGGIVLFMRPGTEGGSGSRPKTGASEACIEQPEKMRAIWQSYVDNRVLPPSGRTGESVEVDEHRWEELPRINKISLALAAFCRIADANGRGTVYLVGWRDGDTKASVADGNYFD